MDFTGVSVDNVAGILWLGNVEFDAEPDESARVRPDQALNNAAALLQCDPGDLAKVLSSKVINAGGETILTALKMDAALDTRCALHIPLTGPST